MAVKIKEANISQVLHTEIIHNLYNSYLNVPNVILNSKVIGHAYQGQFIIFVGNLILDSRQCTLNK